jgi:hypothetical protein
VPQVDLAHLSLRHAPPRTGSFRQRGHCRLEV